MAVYLCQRRGSITKTRQRNVNSAMKDLLNSQNKLLKFTSFIFTAYDNEYIHVSLSIGIAQLSPDMNADTLKDNADKAMYESKNTGRNKISFS